MDMRAWKAYGLAFPILFAIAFIGVCCTTKADAQQVLCAPAEVFIRQTIEVQKQRPVWEGVIPIEGEPPAEVVLLQSDKGVWSFSLIQKGQASLIFTGSDANPPINIGKDA